MKPGAVLAYSGDAKTALIAWLLGGILTLAGGLTVAEIGTQIPKTGGLYTYLEEVYGEFWGFCADGFKLSFTTRHYRSNRLVFRIFDGALVQLGFRLV